MKKLIYSIGLILALTFSANLRAEEKIDDIRIVIDVSGSMKKTDPSNLRVSALKLLNGLIPNGARAGVWTFGRYVNMTVKWGKVDDNWRKLADIGADEIHSNALYTNIERALARATKGWEKADPKTRRNLILLTDGQVDVSKDVNLNEQSRQSVLGQGIQKLKQSGVQVHAIALSGDADEVLLKRLALESEGSFEIAETASDLQKIFFRMFERAVQPDTVTLQDNQFTVDSKIKEMTLLVFRQKGSKKTRIFPPKQKALSARRPGDSKWRSDEGYDLITITNPRKGAWTIEADVDPDNRVMVVTELKLDVSGIPTYLTPAQALTLNAALYNKGKQISKNSFLRFVEFDMTHVDADAVKMERELKHSRDRKQKGQYLYEFEEGLSEGMHSILVTASSRTFSRNKRVDLTVQWPVQVDINPVAEPGNYQISIAAREEYLKSDTLQATVRVEAPDKTIMPLQLNNDKGVWRADISTGQEGMYRALVEVVAQTQAGDTVKYDLGGYSMIGVYKPPPAVEVADTELNPDTTASQQSDTASDSDASTQTEVDEGPDWVFTSIIVGAANLALIIIGVGIFLVKRRKTISAEFSLE